MDLWPLCCEGWLTTVDEVIVLQCSWCTDVGNLDKSSGLKQ